MHAERAVGALALHEAAARDLAEAGGDAQHHVDERRRLDQAEVHRVAAGEVEHLAGAQVRFDLGPIDRLLYLVRHQHQQHVGAPHRGGDAHHLEPVVAGRLGVAVVDVADDHLEPGVAQVLRLRMPLAAVPERCDQLPLQGREIGILLQVQSVAFRFLLHFSILSSAEQQRRVRGSPS